MHQTRTDRLSDFAYKDHRARWKFYLWTMAAAISYGCLNTLVLDRPEETVTYEVLAICVLAHVVFLSYYLLRNRSAVATKKRRRLAKPQPKNPATPSWRFPRFLPYAGFVAAMILFAMARVSPNQLEAKVVGFGLTILPSSVVSAHVPTILNGARDHDVMVSPSVLQRTGLRIIRASDKKPNVWSAAKATLDYRSFLNEQLGEAPKVVNAKDPAPNWPYMFALNTKPSSGSAQSPVWIARVKVEGAAPPENSARLEKLSSPQPPASGVRLIMIEGKNDTIVLDGEYWKDVIVKDAKVEYDGGPLKLENVYFVSCEFILPQTPGGRAFAAAILKGGATDFQYGKVGPPDGLPPEAQLSTDELRAKVSKVSQQLREWVFVRKAAEQELNNRKWLLHGKKSGNPSSVTDEEINKNDDYWDKKIQDTDEKSYNDLKVMFAEADKLRKEMLRRLPPAKWTQEDRDKDKDQIFMGIEESSAADYLDQLAKKI